MGQLSKQLCRCRTEVRAVAACGGRSVARAEGYGVRELGRVFLFCSVLFLQANTTYKVWGERTRPQFCEAPTQIRWGWR